MSAFFNELEPYAVQWLRNLVAAGHITPGVVDGRSVKELSPSDITTPQAHFFAGIGVWSHALREAGYPDDFNVWSGSCPCQPFSAAGRRAGIADARHLWPDWFRLIRECRPACVVGEQVASPDGLAWLDAVQADLEGAGYAFAAFDLCAAGVGAPHIRQRLYFAAIRLADAGDGGRRRVEIKRGDQFSGSDDGRPEGQRLAQPRREDGGLALDSSDGRGQVGTLVGGSGSRGSAKGLDERPLHSRELSARRLGHADCHGAGRHSGAGAGAEGGPRLRAVSDEPRASGAAGRLGFAGFAGFEGLEGQPRNEDARGESRRLGAQPTGSASAPGPTGGHWRDVDWLPCRDGKWRPVEPGTFPLAHGASQRVGRLRAYGNAIVGPLAVAFLEALKPSVAHLFARRAA